MQPNTSAQFQWELRDNDLGEEKIHTAFDDRNQKIICKGRDLYTRNALHSNFLASVIFRMKKIKLFPLRQDENTVNLSLFCIYSGIYCFDICKLNACIVFYSQLEQKQYKCLHSHRLFCSLKELVAFSKRLPKETNYLKSFLSVQ